MRSDDGGISVIELGGTIRTNILSHVLDAHDFAWVLMVIVAVLHVAG